MGTIEEVLTGPSVVRRKRGCAASGDSKLSGTVRFDAVAHERFRHVAVMSKINLFTARGISSK